MSTVTEVPGATPAPGEDVVIERRQRAIRRILKSAFSTRRGQIGAGLATLVLLIAFVGPLLPHESATAFAAPNFSTPGTAGAGLLGTDTLGRDVLARVLNGGWILLLLAILSTLLTIVIGAAIGVNAAYRRGWVEGVLMRGVDVVLAMPQLVFVLLMLSVIGPKRWLLVLAVGLSQAPQTARIVYAAAQDVCERDFVKAVAVWGVPPRAVLRRHVLPSLVTPLMVETGLRLSFSIILISGLSFLGLGTQPPAPDWGVMINENRLGLGTNYWGVLAPAILLALLSIGTNMFADAIARANLGENRSEQAVVASAGPSGAGGLMSTAVEPRTGAALAVEGLTIVMRRSRIPIVADVSFAVAPGKVMGLVGESGSGKSTVGLALLGYVRSGLEISGGSVRLGETEILELRGNALRQARGRMASYVPQDPASALNPAMRLGSQLREAIIVHDGVLDEGESVEDRTRALLHEVNLPDTKAFLKSYPHQTSGGQQQRIGIAMAFACRPRLVVLDEPTTGLDVTTQRHILETIRQLTQAHQTTAVYVSHDLPVVAEIADDTAVMYAGQLVEHAAAERIFTAPRHPYTGGLLKAAPTPDRASVLVGIEGQPPRPGQWPVGCSFADRCGRVQPDCTAGPVELESVGPKHIARCLHPLGDADLSQPSAADAVGRITGKGVGALSLQGVNAYYGDKQVLHGVDLEIAPGGCLAVVGESGSGKTTLARCVVGLHANWNGTATVDGEPLAPAAGKRTARQRRVVQYVFQNPHASLNPRMSVAENIEEPLRYFEDMTWQARRAKVLETLELVALGEDFADRMPGQLSGGERQRVAVGRALIVEPELMICDEITSALDVSVQALLVEQLRRLQQERGLTALFITHNLSVVASIAQEVIVLEQGRVVERGATGDLLRKPQHPYTQQLMADLPRFPAHAAVA